MRVGLIHGPRHFRRARASSNRWIETGSTVLAHSAVLRWEGQFKDPTREPAHGAPSPYNSTVNYCGGTISRCIGVERKPPGNGRPPARSRLQALQPRRLPTALMCSSARQFSTSGRLNHEHACEGSSLQPETIKAGRTL